jgi:catechol 2,3-dioxygenase-like lactoylglutathione lyase family enzyme
MTASAATPALGPILAGTVPVPDLDAATRAYTGWMGFVVQEEGVVSPELAAAWGAPRAAGSRMRLLGSAPDRIGGVRLVERPEVDLSRSPLLVPGWRSLELCVSDVYAVHERLAGSPFRHLAGPAAIGDTPLHAMQCTGPGRELLYLTQTVLDTGFDLPLAEHLVDRQFIAVLSARDLEESLAWYEAAFGGPCIMQPEPYVLDAVCIEAGMPTDARYRIAAVALAGQALVEVDDHFPEHLSAQPPADDLRPGIAMVTWQVASLDEPAVRAVLRGAPERHAGQVYGGRRSAIAVGAAGELLELVEA